MAKPFKKYEAYPFTSRDPIMDYLLIVKEKGKFTNKGIKELGGPASGTMQNWWRKTGKRTRRPQFSTIAAAASAMGLTQLPITATGRKQFR